MCRTDRNWILWSNVVTRAFLNIQMLHLTLILLMRNIGWDPISNPVYSYIQQDATLHSLYLETALHVWDGTSTHHQKRNQLYLQHLVFSQRFCYLPLSWKSWNSFECAVGGESQLTLLHGCALGERSSGGIWKLRTSSFKCYIDHSYTMPSSGNIAVWNWVHLFETRCIY
jgi:hypothetical protein